MSKVSKVTTKTPVKESLSFLIESELERAEIILAAKSVTDKVSKMSSDLISVEGDDILPMLDTLVTAFGPEIADQFKNIAVTNLRQAAEAVMAAKSAIDAELAKLEAILNGEPAPEVAPPAAIGAPANNDMASGAGLDAEDDDQGEEDEATLPDDSGISADDFGDEGDMDGSFAGRARKESVEKRGRVIAEAELRGADGDAVVLRAFRSMIKEGASGALAARSVARHYGIDISDVVSVVKEAFEAGKRFPLLHKNSLMSKNSKSVNEGAKSKGVPDKHQEKICRDTVKNPSKSMIGGPDAKEAEKTLRSKFGYDDKKIAKLKEDVTPVETPQPVNPSDVQKAKTLATKIKGAAPGGQVPLNKVSGDIEKNIGAVGKNANDIGDMSPLVTKELDSMGAIKEGDEESPVAGGGHDAFASWLDNRHNTLMSKVMNGTVDEECEVSPVPAQRAPGETGPNELMSKAKGQTPKDPSKGSPKGPFAAKAKPQGEEKEIDEVSSKTLSPYVAKAKGSLETINKKTMAHDSASKGFKRDSGSRQDVKDLNASHAAHHDKQAEKSDDKYRSREGFIKKAEDKIKR